VLRELAGPEVQWIIYGVIMILILFFLPQGIVPALTSWWEGRRAHETVPGGGVQGGKGS
jgi:branched-chain amino acid transport system permease protein